MLVFQKATKSIQDKLKSSWLAINVHHSECNKNVKEQRLIKFLQFYYVNVKGSVRSRVLSGASDLLARNLFKVRF